MAPFRSERYAAWTDFRRQHLHWFSPAIAVDWLLAVAITWLAAKVERTYPYERAVEHYLGDVDLTWPHTWHERVPGPLLTRLAFWLPAALCAAVALVRVSLHELHHSLLVLYGSRAIMAMVVECLKNRVSLELGSSVALPPGSLGLKLLITGRSTQARLPGPL